MAIAQRHNDRYKYLEDRIEEKGGVEHLEDSDEWFELGVTSDGAVFDHSYFDVYMHRTRFFKATVHFNTEKVEDDDGEVDIKRIEEDYTVKVNFCKPRHHYDEEEGLPPIHETYTKDPANE